MKKLLLLAILPLQLLADDFIHSNDCVHRHELYDKIKQEIHKNVLKAMKHTDEDDKPTAADYYYYKGKIVGYQEMLNYLYQHEGF